MAEFELPTSMYVGQVRVPPEVEQLCLYLATAVDVIPDVAPVLSLGAVTGMRRGELVALRRSRVFPERGYLTVDGAVDDSGVKVTKTRSEHEVVVDEETIQHRGCCPAAEPCARDPGAPTTPRLALTALTFGDAWAEDPSVLHAPLACHRSAYVVVGMGVPALVVTLAAWAVAAWYIDVTIAPRGTFAWFAAVTSGLFPASRSRGREATSTQGRSSLRSELRD